MTNKTREKLYYKIGEVADIVGVENHVLRFWESEFPQIKPSRAGSRQRLYRQKDVAIFKEIKRLLYEERFTLEGTRKKLSQPNYCFSQTELFAVKEGAEDDSASQELLAEIKRELQSLKDYLTKAKPNDSN